MAAAVAADTHTHTHTHTRTHTHTHTHTLIQSGVWLSDDSSRAAAGDSDRRVPGTRAPASASTRPRARAPAQAPVPSRPLFMIGKEATRSRDHDPAPSRQRDVRSLGLRLVTRTISDPPACGRGTPEITELTRLAIPEITRLRRYGPWLWQTSAIQQKIGARAHTQRDTCEGGRSGSRGAGRGARCGRRGCPPSLRRRLARRRLGREREQPLGCDRAAATERLQPSSCPDATEHPRRGCVGCQRWRLAHATPPARPPIWSRHSIRRGCAESAGRIHARNMQQRARRERGKSGVSRWVESGAAAHWKQPRREP